MSGKATHKVFKNQKPLFSLSLSQTELYSIPSSTLSSLSLVANRDGEGFLIIHQLTIAVSHELAHLWLGNLVTMEWQSHLWLNEGFATWVKLSHLTLLLPLAGYCSTFIFLFESVSDLKFPAGESHLNALLREVFHKTLKEAIQRFQTLLNDRNTYLLSMDTRKVQDQDIIFMLFLISSEGCEVAWRWLKFCSNEKADEIEAFFASRMHPSFTMSLKQSMEQIDSKRGGLTTKGESNLYKT